MNLGGVSDFEEEKLRLCAQEYGVTNEYKDYERLLEHTTLDAVSICAPNSQHYRLARTALAAGKHILIEAAKESVSTRGAAKLDAAKAMVRSVKA